MLHHELAAPSKQIAQCRLPGWPIEHIVLVDLDPGQRAALLVQALARLCQFLFAREMDLARGDPRLA